MRLKMYKLFMIWSSIINVPNKKGYLLLFSRRNLLNAYNLYIKGYYGDSRTLSWGFGWNIRVLMPWAETKGLNSFDHFIQTLPSLNRLTDCNAFLINQFKAQL